VSAGAVQEEGEPMTAEVVVLIWFVTAKFSHWLEVELDLAMALR
jgi:hypothetical protein